MLFCKRFNSMRSLSLINKYDKYLTFSLVFRHFKAFNSLINQNFINISLIHNRVKQKCEINCFNNFVKFENFSNDSKINQKCWKCDHLLSDKTNESNVLLFCIKCNAIQALNPKFNYFELFKIGVSFDVNLMELSQQFVSLQMRSHPDKFGQKSEKEIEYSMDNSSLINKAYKTLCDPYERGQYLLDILCNHSSIKETDTGIDTEFLNKIMKLNEEIEANDASKDSLKNILKQNEQYMKDIQNEISIAFSSQNYIRAKELLGRLKFYYSANHKLKERLLK